MSFFHRKKASNLAAAHTPSEDDGGGDKKEREANSKRKQGQRGSEKPRKWMSVDRLLLARGVHVLDMVVHANPV